MILCIYFMYFLFGGGGRKSGGRGIFRLKGNHVVFWGVESF